ncbi:hypothetical protein T440DRAFT_468289 [Plenodomus tracheiphilus IPT5]|uniref:Uncharacterized protein n=1 Tax=Plenodomus tracheiphilus IPT5 TaxID=1408161 RepID=A0A6A7B8Z4_9PLEO|nr:hypothetical protein T440DRAFT_468289 [Plenodomus tracheiphilus IPT5]
MFVAFKYRILERIHKNTCEDMAVYLEQPYDKRQVKESYDLIPHAVAKALSDQGMERFPRPLWHSDKEILLEVHHIMQTLPDTYIPLVRGKMTSLRNHLRLTKLWDVNKPRLSEVLLRKQQ